PVRLMIGTDRVVRADHQTLESTPNDRGEPCGRGDEPAERPLSACACSIDQDAAAVAAVWCAECVDPLLERACGIAAVEGDLGHQGMTQAVQQHVGRRRVLGRFRAEPLGPLAIPSNELRMAGACPITEPARDNGFIEMDEQALVELLDGWKR